MTQCKSILKGLLTIIVLSVIFGSTLVELQSTDIGQKQIGFPVIVFLAFATLHWFVWQFIVPEYRVFGSDAKSLIAYPVPRSCFSYSIAIGYASIALHCLTIGGHLTEHDYRNGHLLFGSILISLGVAARLRCVVYESQHRTGHDDQVVHLSPRNNFP